MKSIIFVYLIGMALILTSCSSMNDLKMWTVKSPNGKITVAIELAQEDSEAESNGGMLHYTVSHGSNTVIEKSALGLFQIFVQRLNPLYLLGQI